ncbi:MAG TPA: hypothetical protein VFG47_16220, partial [Geminicoccaceae bacterium]|nr:hypothetical protein [Geminicoccaceae bacterium]
VAKPQHNCAIGTVLRYQSHAQLQGRRAFREFLEVRRALREGLLAPAEAEAEAATDFRTNELPSATAAESFCTNELPPAAPAQSFCTNELPAAPAPDFCTNEPAADAAADAAPALLTPDGRERVPGPRAGAAAEPEAGAAEADEHPLIAYLRPLAPASRARVYAWTGTPEKAAAQKAWFERTTGIRDPDITVEGDPFAYVPFDYTDGRAPDPPAAAPIPPPRLHLLAPPAPEPEPSARWEGPSAAGTPRCRGTLPWTAAGGSPQGTGRAAEGARRGRSRP